MYEVTKVCEGYGLIEGPVWQPGRGLMFSDVTFGGVFVVDRGGNVSTVFEHRRGIGGMALHQSGGLVVSGRNIAYKGFDGSATVELFNPAHASSALGFNDITTDAAGRIYAGSLAASPFAMGSDMAPGELWLIDLDGSAQSVASEVLVTNGLGFSPDGRRLYHADSARSAIMMHDVFDDGTLGPKQVFATTERGVPDGLVVSEDGAVWTALAAGGSAVAVYEPSGELRGYIELPVPMGTSVCFGGDDLRELWIVTGSDGLDTDRGGAVFVADVDVAGLPVAPCQVSLG